MRCGVAHRLEGSVLRAGRRVRTTAQLIQVSDQTHLWARPYERGVGDILAIQSDVATAIASEIKIKLRSSFFEEEKSKRLAE